MLVIILGIWIFNGIISANLAQNRGRHTLAGFFSGLIFGWFSWLYYLMVGDTVEHRVRKEQAAKIKLGI